MSCNVVIPSNSDAPLGKLHNSDIILKGPINKQLHCQILPRTKRNVNLSVNMKFSTSDLPTYIQNRRQDDILTRLAQLIVYEPIRYLDKHYLI